MGHGPLFDHYLQQYGYWAVAAALLLENAGIPLPGETILIVAAVLARSRHTLDLSTIIVIATLAATVGDNLGYALGRWGGRPLLERYQALFRVTDEALHRAEAVFTRWGAWTIFFARFVFGLRIIAGPLAGTLKMEWQRFLVFNALGAVTWVTVIASAGYLFGNRVQAVFGSLNVAGAVVLVLVVAGITLAKHYLARQMGN